MGKKFQWRCVLGYKGGGVFENLEILDPHMMIMLTYKTSNHQ